MHRDYNCALLAYILILILLVRVVVGAEAQEGSSKTHSEPPLSPGQIRVTVENDAESDIGRNLVPNPSFEIVDGVRPKHWAWDRRNTDAEFELVEDAHSGQYAVRITNGTPKAPHVYGHMILVEGLSLEPGEQYTLSIFAKSEDPGAAWTGGGDGWWMRLRLDGTDNEWRRFSKTFTARAGDVNFPLMVNTDSPTDGFIVDDIVLQRGAGATPFLDPTAAGKPVEMTLQVPEVVSCASTEISLTGFAYLQEGVGETDVEATITPIGDGGGASATAGTPATPGLNAVTVTWALPHDPPDRCRITLRVGQAAIVQQTFKLLTSAHFRQARENAVEVRQRLEKVMEEATGRGIAVDYARAAAAIARRFIGVAGRKNEAELIGEAVDDAEFLARLCYEQIARLRAAMAGQAPEFAVRDPQLDRIEIRDGNFQVDGRPVMLVGALGYGELHNELDGYRDYGFNVIGDDFDAFSAFRMLTGENEFDETAIPRLRENWRRMHEMNLAIAYNPTLHYFPQWALRKYPDITGGDVVDRLPDWSGLGRDRGQRTKSYGGFFPFAIDSPNLRRLVKQYYGKLMPALSDMAPFHVIWLMNEPTYHSQDPHYIELFREYLRGKFADIGALNEAWGTEHQSFAQIGYPQQKGSPAKFDWLTFHQDQVASWFEWLAAQIKRHHPDAVLSNKPMSWTLLDPERGIDFEREAELWEVPGCDGGRTPFSDTYSFNWVDPVLLFDFQKSVAPDKPLADHEYHYVHWPNVTSDYVRATYFHSYLHGLRMSQFWVWATGRIGEGEAGAGMRHTAWSQPKVAWGTASAALDLRRLARVIAQFPQRTQVRLYVSRASLYMNHDVHKSAITNAYQAANSLDAPVGFVTDKMIRNGELANCSLLIVPAASHVEPDVRETIAEYMTAGGRVVFIGECLGRTQYGRAYDEPIADTGARVSRLTGGQPREMVTALDEAFEAAGIERPVRAVREDGRPAWPIECRSAVIGGDRICYLIGLNKEPMRVRLEGNTPIAGWKDLNRGTTGDGAELIVKPLEVRILQLVTAKEM